MTAPATRTTTNAEVAALRAMITDLVTEIDDANDWDPVFRVDVIDILLRGQVQRIVNDVFDDYRQTRLPALRRHGHLAVVPDPSELLA